ncbi:MAG: PAS domain-containing protein [Sphingomonadales bacterium]|nr:PAS domain-containing protein [Sphingomonadales bacterium]
MAKTDVRQALSLGLQSWQQTLPDRPELLEVALGALNVARDNKALVVVRAGAIIDINQRALDLCGFLPDDLLGQSVMSKLFTGSPPPTPTTERWDALLKPNRARP